MHIPKVHDDKGGIFLALTPSIIYSKTIPMKKSSHAS